MGRNAVVSWIIQATWLASGSAQSAAPDPFLGDWHTIGQPEDLTRVVIERTGSGLSVKIWSHCVPSDCYWGESAAAIAADGNSISATFRVSYADLSAELALLTEGSLQVSMRDLAASSKRKGSLEYDDIAYLTKGNAGVFRGLPGFTVSVPNPPPSRPAEVTKRADPPCVFQIDPIEISFDASGGEAPVAVHTASGCTWTTVSDTAWVGVAAGSSGTGEGQVLLRASANPAGLRTGAFSIGGVPLSVNQSGSYRDWKIPLVSFGPNYWSIVRITNPSMVSQPVKVDIYQDSGEQLRVRPVFDLDPSQTLEVVIEAHQVEIYRRSSLTPGQLDGPRVLEFSLAGALPAVGSSWIRIAQVRGDQMPELEVNAFEEVLNGDKLSDFKKQPEESLDLDRVTLRTSEVRGLQIYFLNLSDRPTTVAFCATNKVQQDVCTKKDSFANLFSVKPNQFRVASVNNVPQKYIFVRSSNPGRAIFLKLVPAQGPRGCFPRNHRSVLVGLRGSDLRILLNVEITETLNDNLRRKGSELGVAYQ